MNLRTLNTSRLWLDNINQGDWSTPNVGGKAHHLSEMVKWGLNVPKFGALTVETFHDWKKEKVFSNTLTDTMNESFKQWNSAFYAVRSSMSLEDGISTSFAGIFETFLFVEKDDVIQKVIECYKSIYSDRAQMYMKANDIDIDQLGVSVVVQVMVDARCSGISFSRNPQGHSGLSLIEAGLGLGEGVVAGLVDVDRFSVDRFGRLWESHISEKNKRTLYNSASKNVELVEVFDSQANRPSLNFSEIEQIFQCLMASETQLKKPVDMEWAVDQNGELFFLQARPITQKFDQLHYFADTNLAESYPRRVSRFTADLVPQAYSKVIGETLFLMGARWKNSKYSEAMETTLKGLIQEVSGHLYYQLENYYAILFIFPGGDENIQAWHNMIGGHSLEIPYQKMHLFSGLKKPLPYLKLIYFLLRHSSIYSKFISSRFTELAEKRTIIHSAQTSQEAAVLAKKFFSQVNDWGLTSLNDIFVILGLKILNKFIQKYHLEPEIITEWLKTSDQVDSLDALIELKKLQSSLKLIDAEQRNQFWKVTDSIINVEEQLCGQAWKQLFELYNQNGWSHQADLIQSYLTQFGERCFEELKIESMPFSESPREFFKVLRQDVVNFESPLKEKQKTNLTQISIMDRFILRIVLYFSRKAVAARESTRLMRGRFYGLLRSAVLKTADLFISENRNLHSELSELGRKDFFELTMQELDSYGIGQTSALQLIQNLTQARQLKEAMMPIEYPELYSAAMNDLEPYFLTRQTQLSESGQDHLLGLGVSTGTVVGYALVLTDPRDALSVADLSDKILVTRSTDPAWIFIMSKCKGLVSEKGSLLSHTAIVGRELGIPTVVGVRDATLLIKSSMQIRINGKSGLIEFL